MNCTNCLRKNIEGLHLQGKKTILSPKILQSQTNTQANTQAYSQVMQTPYTQEVWPPHIRRLFVIVAKVFWSFHIFEITI